MDGAEKVQENRARRAAKRQGLELQRHRGRDPRHALYGTYQIARPDGAVVAAKEHEWFGRTYGLSLDEAEKILNGLITPADAAEPLRNTPIRVTRMDTRKGETK